MLDVDVCMYVCHGAGGPILHKPTPSICVQMGGCGCQSAVGHILHVQSLVSYHRLISLQRKRMHRISIGILSSCVFLKECKNLHFTKLVIVQCVVSCSLVYVAVSWSQPVVMYL